MGYHEALMAAVVPSRAEIVAAKGQILAHLTDAEGAVDRDALVRIVTGGENPRSWPRGEVISWPSETPLEDHPLIHVRRQAHAAIEALAELEHAGIIQPVTTDAAAYGSIGGWTVKVSPRPGATTGATIKSDLPLTGPRHRLSRRARTDDGQLLTLDVDLYLSGLASISVDDRVIRTLTEAIDAYRGRLYLAAASLLGSAVEGVWMHTAQDLEQPSRGLQDAVGRQPPSIAAVQDALIEMIEPVHRYAPKELAPHAGLIRDIRNYGLHLGQEADEHLDGYFTEDTVAALFMSTRRHLEILDESISRIG